MEKTEILKEIATQAKQSGSITPIVVDNKIIYSTPEKSIHYMDERQKICMPDVQGMNILDIGCNTGYDVFKYSERGAKQATGVDIDDWRIQIGEIVRELNDVNNVNFVTADYLDFIKNVDTTYDIITSFSSLSFNKAYSHLPYLFNKTQRVILGLVNFDMHNGICNLEHPINDEYINHIFWQYDFKILKSYDFGGGIREYWISFIQKN